MKICIHMKTPDALDNAIDNEDVGPQEEEVRQLASKWIEYGEYVTLILDTEEKTCVVAKRH